MYGKFAVFEGDPVQCPACDSIGVTECVQPYMPNTSPDGRQCSLDGDLYRCKCSPPPRLKALAFNCKMSFSKTSLAKKTGIKGWLEYAGHGKELTSVDQHFVVHDRTGGRPFSAYAYALKTQTGFHEDELYEDGATAKAYAEEEKQVELVYLVQTTIGVRE